MLINQFLSFIIVGAFFAAFSIFVRAVLPYDECDNTLKAANLLENIYLGFLAICLLLSITVDLKWAETGYRLCSLVMG